MGTRHADPETGELRIECPGFNAKNEYVRATARQRQERGLPEPVHPSQWIAKIDRTTSFAGCPVPLDVVLCTPDKNPAGDDAWAIMTTAEDATAAVVVDRYGLRVGIEERHRHIKCFWNIALGETVAPPLAPRLHETHRGCS